MSRTLAENLDKTVSGLEVLAHVLLVTGQTVTAWSWEVNPEGLLMGEIDGRLVLVDPAHVVATFIPEDEDTPLPWGAR